MPEKLHEYNYTKHTGIKCDCGGKILARENPNPNADEFTDPDLRTFYDFYCTKCGLVKERLQQCHCK